jgi:hypothetical protein
MMELQVGFVLPISVHIGRLIRAGTSRSKGHALHLSDGF